VGNAGNNISENFIMFVVTTNTVIILKTVQSFTSPGISLNSPRRYWSTEAGGAASYSSVLTFDSNFSSGSNHREKQEHTKTRCGYT
jgi:hypothetical protein